MSVLQRCQSYRESNKGSKERQGKAQGVRFTGVRLIEVSFKRESTVPIFRIITEKYGNGGKRKWRKVKFANVLPFSW